MDKDGCSSFLVPRYQLEEKVTLNDQNEANMALWFPMTRALTLIEVKSCFEEAFSVKETTKYYI